MSGAGRTQSAAAAPSRRSAWRLMAATAVAVAVATSGVLLTVWALSEGARPNPYVALSLLLGGVVLIATTAVALRSSQRD